MQHVIFLMGKIWTLLILSNLPRDIRSVTTVVNSTRVAPRGMGVVQMDCVSVVLRDWFIVMGAAILPGKVPVVSNSAMPDLVHQSLRQIRIMLMRDGVVSAPDSNITDLATTTYPVTPCANGSFCCGNSTIATECCIRQRGYFVVNGSATLFNPVSFKASSARSSSTSFASSASSSAISSSTISSSTVSPTSVSPALTSAKYSAGETAKIVGGTAGGMIVLVMLCGGALMWKRYRRRKIQDHDHKTMQLVVTSDVSEANVHGGLAERDYSEMNGANAIQQLEPSRTWYELQHTTLGQGIFIYFHRCSHRTVSHHRAQFFWFFP